MNEKVKLAVLFLTGKGRKTYLTWAGITFFISALFYQQIYRLTEGWRLPGFLTITILSLVTRPYGTNSELGLIYGFTGAEKLKFWRGKILLWVALLSGIYAILFVFAMLQNESAAMIVCVWVLMFSTAAIFVNILPDLTKYLRVASEPPVQNSKSVLIIGPSGAGKTGSVACLAHAARQYSQFSGNAEIKSVSVHAENDETVKLFDDAISILRRSGEYPHIASDRITDFRFSLNCTTSKDVTYNTIFEFIDGPGGTIFPDKKEGRSLTELENIQACKDKILERATDVDGIILCINVNIAKDQIDILDSGLRNLFYKIKKNSKIKRFSIFFLQVDKYLVTEQQKALSLALDTDPVILAEEHLTPLLIKDIKSNLPGADLVVGIGSTYGFIENGQANFNNADDEFLLHQDWADNPADVLKQWKPFQILDPYIFMATGSLTSLKRL